MADIVITCPSCGKKFRVITADLDDAICLYCGDLIPIKEK